MVIEIIKYKNDFITLDINPINGLIYAYYKDIKKGYLFFNKKDVLKKFKTYLKDVV